MNTRLTHAEYIELRRWVGLRVEGEKLKLFYDWLEWAYGQQTEADDSVPLIELPDGRWHVDGREFVRVPDGVKSARAIAQRPLRTTRKNAHAKCKSIRTSAMRWARRRAPNLVPMLKCFHVTKLSADTAVVAYQPQPDVQVRLK